MITAVLILSALNTAAIAYYIIWRARWMIDAEHVARTLASSLLDGYSDDLHALNEYGTKQHIRQTYSEAAAAMGLPLGPSEQISNMVWAFVLTAIADADEKEKAELNLYD